MRILILRRKLVRHESHHVKTIVTLVSLHLFHCLGRRVVRGGDPVVRGAHFSTVAFFDPAVQGGGPVVRGGPCSARSRTKEGLRVGTALGHTDDPRSDIEDPTAKLFRELLNVRLSFLVDHTLPSASPTSWHQTSVKHQLINFCSGLQRPWQASSRLRSRRARSSNREPRNWRS